MSNPFDLPGPQFLLFYGVLGVAVTIVAVVLRRGWERPDLPARPLSDYLEIAFLRGGAAEATLVAILTLVDRGVLALSGDDSVVVGDSEAARRLTRPSERAIAERATSASTVSTLAGHAGVVHAVTAECEPELVRRGLLPTRTQRGARHRLWLIAAAILIVVAGTKIAVALSRGRTNVWFLVVLTILFLLATLMACHPRWTPAGKTLVKDMRTLFAGLKERAASPQPPRGGSDLALLAAVFGVSAVLPIYPDARKLFPQASASDDGGSASSGCGSSCGSSCGGGGGGCGGCGS
jgi:uncharacterized protein (TIGR04222 family)